jgi:hypothetical protein
MADNNSKVNYRPQPLAQASTTTGSKTTEATGPTVDISNIPALSEQAIFLALLTGAMAKSTVADYDAKSTAGQNRVKKHQHCGGV